MGWPGKEETAEALIGSRCARLPPNSAIARNNSLPALFSLQKVILPSRIWETHHGFDI
jgi:hypothetical protein